MTILLFVLKDCPEIFFGAVFLCVRTTDGDVLLHTPLRYGSRENGTTNGFDEEGLGALVVRPAVLTKNYGKLFNMNGKK